MKLFFVLPILALLFSCSDQNRISPDISIISPDYIDTISIQQRKQLKITAFFQDSEDLKSAYYSIEDSVFPEKLLSGKFDSLIIDTSFYNSGTFDLTIFATNSASLESSLYTTISSDSVLRPKLLILSSDNKKFPDDTTVSIGSELEFNLVYGARQFPLDSLTIHNSNHDEITAFPLKYSVVQSDTINFKLIVSEKDLILYFNLIDSLKFTSSKPRFLKLQ